MPLTLASYIKNQRQNPQGSKALYNELKTKPVESNISTDEKQNPISERKIKTSSVVKEKSSQLNAASKSATAQKKQLQNLEQKPVLKPKDQTEHHHKSNNVKETKPEIKPGNQVPPKSKTELSHNKSEAIKPNSQDKIQQKPATAELQQKPEHKEDKPQPKPEVKLQEKKKYSTEPKALTSNTVPTKDDKVPPMALSAHPQPTQSSIPTTTQQDILDYSKIAERLKSLPDFEDIKFPSRQQKSTTTNLQAQAWNLQRFLSWLTNGKDDDITDAYNVLFG